MEAEIETKRSISPRKHSIEFKAMVVAECQAPGAIISVIARMHGVNESLARKWLKRAKDSAQPSMMAPSPRGFVPVQVGSSTPAGSVPVEFTGHGVSIKLAWPIQDVEGMTRLLRGVLQ